MGHNLCILACFEKIHIKFQFSFFVVEFFQATNVFERRVPISCSYDICNRFAGWEPQANDKQAHQRKDFKFQHLKSRKKSLDRFLVNIGFSTAIMIAISLMYELHINDR